MCDCQVEKGGRNIEYLRLGTPYGGTPNIEL
jgi:hypothetical protein